MIKDRFTKQLYISLGIILASIAIAAGALYFFSGMLSSQADVIASDRVTVQSKTSAVADLARLEADASQATRYQAAIDQLLPDQYGLVTFTQWLAQLGAKYGVSTNAVFQGSIVPSSETTAGTAQFSFSAAGSPENIVAFLDGMNVKSSRFLISLTSFDVANDETNEKVTGQGILFFR